MKKDYTVFWHAGRLQYSLFLSVLWERKAAEMRLQEDEFEMQDERIENGSPLCEKKQNHEIEPPNNFV